MIPERNRIRWKPSWRLVPSRFPPVGLFDRVSRAEDLDIVQAIEGLTNDRLREEIGLIHLVPKEDRVYGPGTTPIMAAFTHLNPDGSRFTDGSYGAVAFDFTSPHDMTVAKKSWFFFDEEYACLGTGIKSDRNLPVVTTIN